MRVPAPTPIGFDPDEPWFLMVMPVETRRGDTYACIVTMPDDRGDVVMPLDDQYSATSVEGGVFLVRVLNEDYAAALAEVAGEAGLLVDQANAAMGVGPLAPVEEG